jgi:hypothetical protein
MFDVYTGVWLLTQNSAYYPGGSTRQQAVHPDVQAHISYTIRPRLWLALNSTWYAGGATSVDNGPEVGRLNNSRGGATLSIPLAKTQSLKVAYGAGATARSDAKFSGISVAWQFFWFDRPRKQQP